MKLFLINFLRVLILLSSNLIYKFIKFNLVILREDRIGHQAGGFDVELLKAMKRLENKNIKTFFLFASYKKNIANQYLRKLFQDLLKKSRIRYFVLNENFFNRNLIKLLDNKQVIKNNPFIYFAAADWGPRSNFPIILVSNNYHKFCDRLGIEPNKYICIYSRDSKYLKMKYESIDWSYHNYRNSDIDKLRLFSEYVVQNLDLSIVRIGSNVEKKINWERPNHPKIIDYSNSIFQNEKNDIDLVAGCYLFINNGGGLDTVAKAARRKQIRINSIPILEESGYYYGFKIPKLLKNKYENRYLSYREINQLNLARSYKTNNYLKHDLLIQENSPEEILDTFKDFLKIDSNELNDKDIELINRYKLLYSELALDNGLQNKVINPIAPSFLRKYDFLLA